VIVTTADLFRVAYGQFAVGAYNINSQKLGSAGRLPAVRAALTRWAWGQGDLS
jgi:hypothetical protein